MGSRLGFWVALFAMVFVANPALADALYWVVKNDSQTEMIELYVAPNEAGLADEVNLLGNQSLRPGEDIEIEIASDRSKCQWTTRFVFAGDRTSVIDVIDACAQSLYLAALPDPALVVVFDNNGQSLVTELRIAEPGGLESEPNILGDQPLRAGESISITLSRSGQPCVWDVEFSGADGSISRESGIDFCASDTYKALGGASYADGATPTAVSPAADDQASASASAQPPADSESQLPTVGSCDPMEKGEAVGEAVMALHSAEGETPLVKGYFERMTLAFTTLQTGNTAVACAMYEDLLAAAAEKRPAQDAAALGYSTEDQPLAAQPPSAYSQFRWRINLRNASMSLRLNGLPMGRVSSDTNLSATGPLIGWLTNGGNTLEASVEGTEGGSEATLEVFLLVQDAEPTLVATESWTGGQQLAPITVTGEGLPDWAWMAAEDRKGADTEVSAAVAAFLDSAAAGDTDAFKTVVQPVLADLTAFMGPAMAQQMGEQLWGIVNAAAADGDRSLTVNAVGDGRFYSVRRVDGGHLLKLPPSSEGPTVYPGDLWAYIDGAWRMIGFQ